MEKISLAAWCLLNLNARGLDDDYVDTIAAVVLIVDTAVAGAAVVLIVVAQGLLDYPNQNIKYCYPSDLRLA